MGHGAGKNSEVNNLLSLSPCPAARSKPPPRPASRGGDLFRVAQPPGTPACQCRPHVRTGTAQPVQPWRSRIDLVATLVLNQFGNFAAPCRCRRSLDRSGCAARVWVWPVAVWADAATTRVLRSRGRRRRSGKGEAKAGW